MFGRYLNSADLSGANLSYDHISGVTVSDTTWTGATCPSGQQGPYPRA
jgi:uncharacterized protein YjbI with pentapeptide repeats